MSTRTQDLDRGADPGDPQFANLWAEVVGELFAEPSVADASWPVGKTSAGASASESVGGVDDGVDELASVAVAACWVVSIGLWRGRSVPERKGILDHGMPAGIEGLQGVVRGGLLARDRAGRERVVSLGAPSTPPAAKRRGSTRRIAAGCSRARAAQWRQ